MIAFARPLIALAAAAALVPSALALSVGSVADNGNVVDTSFVLPGQIGIDISFFSLAPVSIAFALDTGDAAGSASFNSIVRQVGGGSMTQIRLALSSGALFSTVGSAEALGGGAVATSLDLGAAQARLSTQPGATEFYIGNPLQTGAQDWQIGFGPLADGAAFTLTVTQVPEAPTWALLLAGLGWATFVARPRRN